MEDSSEVTEAKFKELVESLEQNKAKCGVYRQDKTLCGKDIEDLVVVGDTEKGILPLCLEHSEGMELGKGYLIHALNGKDYAVQLSTGDNEIIDVTPEDVTE